MITEIISRPLKERSLFFICLIFLFWFPAYSVAADFSGTWQGPYFYDHEDMVGIPGALTVVITQNGDTVTGIFTTSTGVSGAFSGLVEENQLIANFTGPAGTVQTTGTFAAKMHRGLLIWNGIGTSNHITGTLSGSLTQNWITGDPGHWLNISKYSYPSGLIKADFGGGMSDITQTPIDSVVLVTPLHDEIPVRKWDEDRNSFRADYSFDVSNIDIAYPNGIYSFAVQFKDGTHGACFSSLAGTFPGQTPQFLSPLPDTLVDETNPLPVSWNQWVTPLEPHIGLYFEIGHYVVLANNATQYELPAHTLSDDMMTEFKIEFGRPSGYSGTRSVVANSYLRTSNIVDDHWFGKFKVHLPSGQLAGGMVIGMDAAGVASATLMPPAGATGPPLSLIHGDKQTVLWQARAVFSTFTELNNQYPDGEYILRIVYKDASPEDILLSLGGDYPAMMPHITQPAHLSDLSWWKSIAVQWTNWDAFENTGTFITSNISIMNSPSEADFLSSSEIWGTDEGILSDGMTVPPGILKPGNAYAYTVMFLQETGVPGVLKGTADVVFLNTPVIPDSTLTVSVSGTGKGMVSSNDNTVNCGTADGTCTASYNRDQQVILLAIPEKGSVFAGWSGDTDCMDGVVSMTENKNCIATFERLNVMAPIQLLLLQ